MTPTPDTSREPRSTLRWILMSPEEPRLRAGWRLLLHTLLTMVLVLLFSTMVYLITSLLGWTRLPPSDPTSLDSPLMLLGSLSGITLATWIARRWFDRHTFLSLGFTYGEQAVRDLVFGILMPSGLFALVFLLHWAAGWLTIEGTAFGSGSVVGTLGQLLVAALVFIIVGFQEELLSRGYHLQNLVEGLNLPIGLFLSSAVFALLHAFNPGASVLSTLGILLAGYFLAIGWIRTGQLWLPIGLHIGWNFFQGTVFGFPVSGTGGFHLLQLSIHGPPLLTGGSFGPEAGLTGMAAMALGAFLIFRYTASRRGPFAPAAGGPEQVDNS